MAVIPEKLYENLLNLFGKQKWWPIDYQYHQKNKSDPRFEIMIGAILTQNTAWDNVEKALTNLKTNKTLTINRIVDENIENIRTMIQPSGFFNQKAQRLKILASYLHDEYNDNLGKFFEKDLLMTRQELLSLKGIGPETADSMLLYAGNRPIFVVDAYTKRICKRLPIENSGKTYEEIQSFFETELKRSFPEKNMVELYKELHALIVRLAKTYCRKKPYCEKCPLKNNCEFALS
jgi:endonuclease-3 related protein